MKRTNSASRQLIFYLKLPGSWIFLAVLPFLLTVLIIDFVYLAGFWMVFSGAVIILIFLAFFFGSWSLAKSSFEARVKQDEFWGIIAGLNEGAMVYDQNFRISTFNPAAEKIFGVSAAMVLEKEFTPQDIKKPAYGLLAQALFPSLAPTIIQRSPANVYPQVIDLNFTQPEKSLRITALPLKDSRGRPIGFMKIIQDRTKDIGLLKDKSDFITISSHQLRTPLTSIKWIFETLNKEQNLSDDLKRLVGDGLKLSDKTMRIVNDLLDVAAIEEGRFGYQFQDIDVVKFSEEILSEAKIRAGELGIRIYFESPSEKFPGVKIDAQKLGMVFNNLLNNAIDYNIPKGEVTVRINKLPDRPYLVVSVQDTGIGIPPEAMSKLFTKFSRAENALKYRPEGSGLGLYIVKNIIRAHGGQIWAESELNRGTTFYFTLPTDPRLVPTRELLAEE